MTEIAEPAARREQRRVQEYQMRKGIHDHEWTLLSGRVAAYLASQSLLATGAALLFSASIPHYGPLLFLSAVGFVISFLSSLSTCINCTVLNDSHVFIQELITEDKKDGFLTGFYIPRKQPDVMHKLSTDLFCIGTPAIGGAAWLVVAAVCIIAEVGKQDDVLFEWLAYLFSGVLIALWMGFLWHIRASWSLLEKPKRH